VCLKPGTSSRGCVPEHTVQPYLLRCQDIAEANYVWTMDTAHIPTRHGFVYLVRLIDVVTRRVLVHELCTTLEAHHALEIVEQAIAKHAPPPEIVNTDQGNQFTALEFTETVKKARHQTVNVWQRRVEG
jgi:putative transposase